MCEDNYYEWVGEFLGKNLYEDFNYNRYSLSA